MDRMFNVGNFNNCSVYPNFHVHRKFDHGNPRQGKAGNVNGTEGRVLPKAKAEVLQFAVLRV
jgi:hypothetical protein